MQFRFTLDKGAWHWTLVLHTGRIAAMAYGPYDSYGAMLRDLRLIHADSPALTQAASNEDKRVKGGR